MVETMTFEFTAYDYRTNPDTVMASLRKHIDAVLGPTSTGIVYGETFKGGSEEYAAWKASK